MHLYRFYFFLGCNVCKHRPLINFYYLSNKDQCSKLQNKNKKKAQSEMFFQIVPSISFCYLILDTKFFANILWYGILVNHEIHSVCGNKVLCHIPNSFIFTSFSPD